MGFIEERDFINGDSLLKKNRVYYLYFLVTGLKYYLSFLLV